ncbi:hypothetical protein Scep_017371 [Stephania cephalantha]|uniref:Uncharacterized protein n=1 Tax=Stephania cephalantha TaxID=152367 RepID=A0AAP0IPD1_9MAGN
MQLRVKFAFDENPEEEYSDEEEFVSEEEINEFDDDGRDFVGDKVVFGEDDFVIEVVSHKNPQVLEVVVGDMIVNKSSVKNFSDYQKLFVVSFLDDVHIFEVKVVPNHKSRENTKIQGRIFRTGGE